MKIEEILGYSAEDIKAWDDETLIRNCMEHFVYTRPETNVPVVVKEKAAKKIKSAPVEYIQDENGNFVEAPKAIVKQLSNTEKEKLAAQEMLKKLLTPENLAVFQNLNKNK